MAVFTGTNGGLRNYRALEPLPLDQSSPSRQRQMSAKKTFYNRGSKIFEEFFSMTTIGCLRKGNNKSTAFSSEFNKSTLYGRPLFAAMEGDNKLDEKTMIAIAERMLLIRDDENWTMEDSKKDSWMSILGTRVQMGRTSIDISSSIVARGYANLVGVTKDSAQISFPPDPVCARLAMCLMDEQWTPSNTKAKGKEKKWWVNKVKIMFSEGLCVPEKGDFGEVMVALYFLLCADEERKAMDEQQEIQNKYKTFSVPLDAWLNRLVNGGKRTQVFKGGKHQGPTFGAIQVCRNYLRAYNTDWKELGDQKFLKLTYESGVGFYVFPGCQTIDLVFPLKIADSEFAPLVVSVKSRSYYADSLANAQLEEMRKRAKGAKWKCGLCLLVLFGLDPSSKEKDSKAKSPKAKSPNTKAKTPTNDLASGDASKLVDAKGKGSIVCKILRICGKDDFGISQSFENLTSIVPISEILTSHSFLTVHADAMESDTKRKKEFLNSCVRQKRNETVQELARNIVRPESKVPRRVSAQTPARRRSPRIQNSNETVQELARNTVCSETKVLSTKRKYNRSPRTGNKKRKKL
eukprot:scaffold26664_cov191-Cylindrotheca_fusiformis.AAC.1